MNFDRIEEKLIKKIADHLNTNTELTITEDQIKHIIIGQSAALKSCIELGVPTAFPYVGKFLLKARVLTRQAQNARVYGGAKDTNNLLDDVKLNSRLRESKALEADRIENNVNKVVKIKPEYKLSFMAELNTVKQTTNRRK